MAVLATPGTDAPGADVRGARAGAIGLGVAGVLFTVYPAVRPWSDDAVSMASQAWLVAHLAAIAGFILVALGLLALRFAIGGTGPARAALLTGLTGVGLTLPYYGAEVFGGHTIGVRALADGNPALMDAVEAMRFQPAAATMFAAGLLLVAASGILAAVAVWRSGLRPRSGGIVFAVGFSLFLPQFYLPMPLRLAHGLLVTLGCLWLAAALWRVPRTTS